MTPAPSRPRIAPALARRIDRLAAGAHSFHRFAHHPLCDRYAGELVPLGRRARVCRGCLLAAIGATAGVAVGVALPPSAIASAAALLVALALALLSARVRLPKSLSRLAPAAFAGLSLDRGALPIAAAAALGAAYLLWHRRRGPDRGPCQGCPERAEPVCSGFAPIVRRERAFQRLAGRWLSA